MPTQGQIQAQAGQTAQVTLTKPPVVSVPAVVSSAGVTTLPVTVAGISVAIGQAQKTGVFNVFIEFFFLLLPMLLTENSLFFVHYVIDHFNHMSVLAQYTTQTSKLGILGYSGKSPDCLFCGI